MMSSILSSKKSYTTKVRNLFEKFHSKQLSHLVKVGSQSLLLLTTIQAASLKSWAFCFDLHVNFKDIHDNPTT